MTNHWSGKHRSVVRGINLITLLWTDGDRKIPCDYRIFDKDRDGLTKNDHFWEMLLMAKARGFAPRCILFDGWYSSLENLKQVRDFGWIWLTRLKGNRKVTPVDRNKRALDEVALGGSGTLLHLQGYGMVRVFRIDAPDGVAEYWATNDLGMGAGARQHYAELAFAIENYHRDLKQNCGVEKCQVLRRTGAAQPHRSGGASVLAAGVAFLHYGVQWLGDEDGLGVRGGSELSGPALAHPPESSNRVTPNHVVPPSGNVTAPAPVPSPL